MTHGFAGGLATIIIITVSSPGPLVLDPPPLAVTRPLCPSPPPPPTIINIHHQSMQMSLSFVIVIGMLLLIYWKAVQDTLLFLLYFAI